jgi:hypothetical protein
MWDVEGITKTALTIGAPLATVVGIGSHKRRLRGEIRDNLALAEQIAESQALSSLGLAAGWLHGRIALDIARLTDQKLGENKKPVPWGSVFVAATLAIVFGFWTYWLNRDTFVWYSTFPGCVAALFAIAVAGMFLNRDQSPEELGTLPPGAVAAPTSTASEQIATGLAIAAAGGIDDRLAPGGQADVALRFARLLQLGAYAAALDLAEENWTLCRLKAWLWNNREHFGPTTEELDALVDDILDPGREEAHPLMADFFASEVHQFVTAWESVDFDQYGVASNRRRIAADLDLVIFAPVGKSGGYFITEATAIPNAMTFLVRHTASGWKVANHLGIAPPVASWPPIWWSTVDPAIANLPDPYAQAQLIVDETGAS